MDLEHLADFLGAEKRRRWNEFLDTRLMQCWDCIEVIDKLASAYNLHWDKESQEFTEEASIHLTKQTKEEA